MTRTSSLAESALTRTYSISGPAATAAFEISVQGVVVQTTNTSPAWSGRLGDRVGRRDPGDGELHVGRGVGDVVVAGSDLVGGERGPAARAVGDDLVALVEPARVPHLAHRPPARLDVVVVHRHVGVVEVDPEADALGQPVPVLDVAEDRVAAARVELGDPVLLDLVLGGDPELLLDLELDRQPVAVPARLPRHAVAGHRAVAGVDVLEDPREDVVRAGSPVRGRRPLVEAPERRALLLALRDLASEHVALGPAREDLLFEAREGLLRIDRLESRHHAAGDSTSGRAG